MKKQIILVSIIFIYVIMSLFYFQSMNEFKTSIETDKKELHGIKSIQYLLNLKMQLQRERGISMYSEDEQVKLQNLYNTNQEIENILKSLTNSNIQSQYKSLFLNNKSFTPSEKFNQYTMLIDECTKQIYLLIDSSKLVYEADPNIYNFIVLYAQDIPANIEKMAKIRGYGSKMLEGAKLQDYDKGVLDTYIKSLNDSKQLANLKFDRVDHVLLSKENLNIQTRDTINKFIHFIQTRLPLEFKTLDHAEYFVQSTLFIDTLYNIEKSIYTDIDTRLNERISKKTNDIFHFTIVYILFNLVFILLVFYLYKRLQKLAYSENSAFELNAIEDHLVEFHNTHNFSDLKELCKSILDYLCNKDNIFYASIYLVDQDNKRLSLAETWGINHKELLHHLEFGQGIIGEVGLSKKVKILELNAGNCAPLSKVETIQSYSITAPLVYFDELIGVLDMRTLTSNYDIELLNKKLSIVSKYIYRNIQVSRNEQFMRLFDKEIIVSKTDRLGKITYVSDAFVKISGYSKEELIGKNHNIIRHPDMPKSLYKDLWSTVHAGNTWHGEIKNIRKDGTIYWVDALITPNVDFYGEVVGFTAIREHITDKKKIEEISIKDPMTNLFNRRGLSPILKDLSVNQENQLFIIIVDIDNFKQYNDHYGHEKGDKVLIEVASKLKSLAIQYNGMAFRFGGEEFLIVLPSNSMENSIDFAEKLVNVIQELKIEHKYNAEYGVVTISAGLSQMNKNDFESAYKEADKLLYKAKEQGRNQVCH